MPDDLTPEMKKFFEMQMDHHQEMIDYHSDMLKMMKQITPDDKTASQAVAGAGPYARGSVSPLGGTAKAPMYFKTK